MLLGVIEFIVWVFVGVLFVTTGQIVLFLITLGRHHPRWDFYANEDPIRSVIFTETSFWIGAAVWIAIGISLA